MPKSKILTLLLLFAAASVVVAQAVSLFSIPVPDSIRWFGDESWLMRESMTQGSEGVVRYPEALSSTLAHPKGVILGSTFIRSLLYGVPANLLYPQLNPVDVGRAVSMICGLLVCVVMWVYLRRATQETLLPAIALVALTTCFSFFANSHSARPDMLGGLVILGAAILFTNIEWRGNKQLFGTGALLAFVALGISTHVMLMLAGFALWMLWRRRDELGTRGILTIAGGSLAYVALIVVIRLVLEEKIYIRGPSGQAAEFGDVWRDIPLLQLFSFSAQSTVLAAKASLIWKEALPLVGLILFALGSRTLKRVPVSSLKRPMGSYAVVALLLWYFAERYHPSYLIHILPLLIVSVTLLIHKRSGEGMRMLLGSMAIVWVLLWHAEYWPMVERLQGVARANEKAVHELTELITREGKRPLIMTEASMTRALMGDSSVGFMTTHFQFFPDTPQSISAVLAKHHVTHALMFQTARYGYDRNAIDPLLKTLYQEGRLIARSSGTFFDISRDYRSDNAWVPQQDTILLFQLH